jgi:hypothetical protein
VDLGSFFSDLGRFVGSLINGANNGTGGAGAAGSTGSTTMVGTAAARAPAQDNSTMLLLGLVALALMSRR